MVPDLKRAQRRGQSARASIPVPYHLGHTYLKSVQDKVAFYLSCRIYSPYLS